MYTTSLLHDGKQEAARRRYLDLFYIEQYAVD